MTKLLTLLFIAVLSIAVFSQEMHFSQYNENPALLNPALTGVANTLRASLSYREQWRSLGTPYKTSGVSFETRLNNSSWKQIDRFRSMTFKERGMGLLAWGVSVYNDKAGPGGLSLTNANLNLASFIPISKKSFLSLGVQGGISQRRIENGRLIFPDQYTDSGYSPDLNSDEKFSNLNYAYSDFATGFLWSYNKQQKRIANHTELRSNLGFSIYHLLRPKQDFLYSGNRIYRKYVVHGDFLYEPANFNVAIVPSFQGQFIGSTVEATAGLTVKYYVNDNAHYTGIVKRTCIGFGIYGRRKDAVIPCFLLELKEQYVFGFSYDVNLSSLSPSSMGRGAFEITLRYTPSAPFLYEERKTND